MTELEGQIIKPQFLLLNVALLLHAEYLLLLMKQQIDELVTSEQQLQVFLTWVCQKSQSVSTGYKPVVVRAFYFDLAMARDRAVVGGTLDLALALNPCLTCNLERQLALDLSLDRILGLDLVVELTPDPAFVFECVLKRALAHAHVIAPDLELALQLLKNQLPDSARDSNRFKQWWEANAKTWTEQSRTVMIEHRNIGYDWQFSDRQREVLKRYYNANCQLVDCLNSDRYITREVRQEIEKALLLPMAQRSPTSL